MYNCHACMTSELLNKETVDCVYGIAYSDCLASQSQMNPRAFAKD